jgi:hypothetical protein
MHVDVASTISKRSTRSDYDGASGQEMLWNEMIPRCSEELQKLLRSSTYTKTPHRGHILLMLDSGAFPEGIDEILVLVEICRRFKSESTAIRNIANGRDGISPY